MFSLIAALLAQLRKVIADRRDLLLENAALRQQLAIYQREGPQPKLNTTDRLFWVCLSQFWSRWRSTLLIVQPETVSSSGWRARIRFGARSASAASCLGSALRSAAKPCAVTCTWRGADRHLRPGAPSSRTTPPTSGPATSSPCRRFLQDAVRLLLHRTRSAKARARQGDGSSHR